ncbi:hypothetical protein BXY85_2731 [Roseivirga pacifica]|nr:hypothetical protein BXY85_2731 [Roseivirga pacifica]
MDSEERKLWDKLKKFELDNPSSDYTFSLRLVKENGWSLTYALQAIEEYKKFIFLACTSGHPVTPSDQIDQVWHLHLIYTHSYWIDLCKYTLNREIHHGPTSGGSESSKTFKSYYDQTLNSYRIKFNKPAPSHIWPDCETRFSDNNFRRVNIKENWIIRKP